MNISVISADIGISADVSISVISADVGISAISADIPISVGISAHVADISSTDIYRYRFFRNIGIGHIGQIGISADL